MFLTSTLLSVYYTTLTNCLFIINVFTELEIILDVD